MDALFHFLMEWWRVAVTPGKATLDARTLLIVGLFIVVAEGTTIAQPPDGGRFRGRGGFGGAPTGPRLDPEQIEFKDGVAAIADRETFEELSYQGPDVLIDTNLADLQFVKFQIENANSDQPQLYFINTKTHRAHMMFMRVAGLARGDGQMRGVLVYRPLLTAPNGTPGLYTYEFEPNDDCPFEMVKIAYDVLIEKMPILEGRLSYTPRPRAEPRFFSEEAQYAQAKLPVCLESEFYKDIGYLPLNVAESFGRLRVMQQDDRPSPRDVVLYKSLPNEMPRVAGIITEARQTPLSHVNLRAIQDDLPNAFITSAASNPRIAPLINKNVFYKVTAKGFEIREASMKELEDHFAELRPASPQSPPRDLSVKEIRHLSDIGFEDSASVGVKAANMAAMHQFGFAEGVIPDGYAIPFYFYDQFMKENGFYERARVLLNSPEFKKSHDVQVAELKNFRALIKKGKMPTWMMEALAKLHRSFPAGSSVRCRSSTNNEDLPGFSGAGLYDSYTHHPEEGHFAKTIQQVYASMWNYRAYEEREFYRVDHFAAAMGVLVHPNFSGERANGVAVTEDILYQTYGNYYLNTQVGEDQVTNPQELSVPEEILLDWWSSNDYQVMQSSNRVASGKRILKPEHLSQLNQALAKIHAKFMSLYGVQEDAKFAMEVEFKITKEGKLSIKQARPWVY